MIMCGIFALFLKNHNSKTENFEEVVLENFNKGEPRGPENSILEYFNKDKLYLGFHRLAINGFGKDTSEQPLKIKDCVLICNGEIYNWKELHKLSNTLSITGSDCEIIIHLYKQYGIEQTLQLLDGVFAFVLWDKITNKFFVARDTFGVRPLYVTKLASIGGCAENVYPSISGFSSEIKNIYDTFKFIQEKQMKKIGAKTTYKNLYPITV
jgi:asparagine synthase (glutamine-hydrolysing)